MNLPALINLAAADARATRNARAALCARDAVRCYAANLQRHARRRALDSLRHSVGTAHADYRSAL